MFRLEQNKAFESLELWLEVLFQTELSFYS